MTDNYDSTFDTCLAAGKHVHSAGHPAYLCPLWGRPDPAVSAAHALDRDALIEAAREGAALDQSDED